jgi:predicted dehydrogenase
LAQVRKVAVEYFQGWLSQAVERTGHKQAEWRANPAFNGAGGCIGDIGTHAFHLVEYVTGIDVTAMNATCAAWCPDGSSTTTAMRMLRFSNGATGVDGFAGGDGRTERAASAHLRRKTARSTGSIGLRTA